MKKVTLLTTATLAAFSLCGQPLAAQAACNISNGNMIVYTYGSNCNIQDILNACNVQDNCNIQDILGNLENCFPGIQMPDVEMPDVEIPDVNIPGVETPDTNVPGTETPDVETPDEDSSTNDTHAFIQEVVNLVNAERAKEGLSPLTIDTKVQAAAQVRARECEQSFSHTRPNGSSFATALAEQNVSYQSAGENIAWGQRSPEAVMEAWMNSEGHRANIMNASFTTIGVGYYQNANGTNYWCQLFTR